MEKSQHLWHVDTNNTSEIYNIIVCIKKIGNISPLQYKDKNNKEHSIYFEEGDAALFNGGTTVHQVPPNNDIKSERTVLSIVFTRNKNMKNNDNLNLCTYIKGGNDKAVILNIILTIFIINYLLTHISGINDVPYNLLTSYFLTILLLVKYMPQYFDTGLGTTRSSSMYYNFMLLIFFMLITVSIKGAIIFFTYFLISDLFFSRKWVAYS
jgi:hypothetical protein